jgi:hypothetical protein
MQHLKWTYQHAQKNNETISCNNNTRHKCGLATKKTKTLIKQVSPADVSLLSTSVTGNVVVADDLPALESVLLLEVPLDDPFWSVDLVVVVVDVVRLLPVIDALVA